MKKAVITSALPYANGEIHLGHVASTYLPADITTRFLKLNGVEAYYVCASDDYGTPILIQAEKEKKSPEEYVKFWNKRDYEDFASFGINFDFFYRTSSPENVAFVQDVFKKLMQNGHIYEKEIIQFYCKFDKKFLPDRYVIGRCPYCKAEEQYSDLCEKCGRVPQEIEDPKCSICKNPPIREKTKHYFFKLTNFVNELNKWLEADSHLQRDVKKYVQNWIKDGLVDWDITRDITWGVPIPHGAKDQVFYGWFDNHLAYISSTIKFLTEKGMYGKEFWNSAEIYHFIGKDIVYHHYLFLPATRIGINQEYKLPDYIPTRGHLMLQSKKISKSRNWYIGLKDFLSLYPADYLRFYLTLITPYSQDDLNFDWDEFAARINSELIGNIGNFVNRALGFTQKGLAGEVPSTNNLDETDKEAKDKIKNFSAELTPLMEENNLDKALKKILEFSAYFNQYFQKKEPWKGTVDSNNNCIYISVNAVRSIAISLYPFLPESSQKIWSQLNMNGNVSNQTWNEISEMAIVPGHKIGIASPLFKKVEASDIQVYKSRLGK
jgi:methionyl-tRNA synthetase